MWTKEKLFRFGMDLQQIAMAVDDETLKRIKPKLTEIEEMVKEEIQEQEKKGVMVC